MNKHIQGAAHCLLKLYNDKGLDDAEKAITCEQIVYLVFSLEGAIAGKVSQAEFKDIIVTMINKIETDA